MKRQIAACQLQTKTERRKAMNERQATTAENENRKEVFNNTSNPTDAIIAEEDTMNTSQYPAVQNADNGKAPPQMKLEELDINVIKINYHPRKDLGKLETLQNSIRRDGLQEPLVVYESAPNEFAVIDGCRRLEVAREFGWKKVPCLIKTDVEASEAAHLSYVKNAERNSFNPIEVALHLKAMSEEFGYSLRDLELKGYGTPALISRKMKLLELPETVQKQIRSEVLTAAHGTALTKLTSADEQKRMAKRIIDHDLTARKAERQIERYLAKGRKKEKQPAKPVPPTDIPGVYIKDSRDMSEVPKNSVHLIVSSPPYNIGMDFEKGVPFEEHLEMVRDVLKECARVLVPGGIMALNVDDITSFKGNKGNDKNIQMQLMGHKYQNYLRKHQIFLTDLIIWQKNNAWNKRRHINYTEDTVHTSYRILDCFEPVYIFRKKGHREIPSEEIALKSRLTREEWIAWIPAIWQIRPAHNMEDHPCVWPDELPKRLIRMFSFEGDTVLDPWLGSGTTVKVARELNREAIGYEKEPQYKAVIMKRLGMLPETPEAPEPVAVMAENIRKALAAQEERSAVSLDPTDEGNAETTKMKAEQLATPAPQTSAFGE
jgi:ParB/RepB/Spo0J family partition protein